MDRGLRKRILSSSCVDERSQAAKLLIDQKHSDPRNNITVGYWFDSFKAVDRSKFYVACYVCISEGYPQHYSHGSLFHRRDKLKEHYKMHHPDTLVQEWQFLGINKKQRKLFDRNADEENPEEPEQMEINEDDMVAVEHSHATDMPVENMEDNAVHVEDSPQTDIIEKAEVSPHQFPKVMGFLQQIYDAVFSVKDTVSAMYKLLQQIALKHRVASNQNPLMLNYGKFVTLENKVLVIDGEGISTALRSCKDILQVIGHFPYIGLSEDESYVVCEFCPGIEILHYTAHGRFSQRFGNTKTAVQKHLLSKNHRDNVVKDYEQQKEDRVVMSKDRKAGLAVFRTVYGGLKQGYSFVQMIREIAVLHYHNVLIGNINHSKGTLKKIKDHIGKAVRNKLKQKLSSNLPCTNRPRPVSELFDKMTVRSEVGQMQMGVSPLLNNHELLSTFYVDNYACDPDFNRYRDMVNMVREAGEIYYKSEQVENAGADGAYAKNESTKTYYKEALSIKNDWVRLRWDYAHSIDLAEGDARKICKKIDAQFDTAQEITKIFRYGKQFSRAFGGPAIPCVSLADSNNSHELGSDRSDEEDDELEHDQFADIKFLHPVLKSELKFAAHGSKFLKNYSRNLPLYVQKMNLIQVDPGEDPKKVEKVKGLLTKITVEHVTTVYLLLDIYSVLSKGQHGVSKVNQLPWEFDDRVKHLLSELENINGDKYKGFFDKHRQELLCGLLPGGMPIVTELPRLTRSREVTVAEEQSEESPNQVAVAKAQKLVNEYTIELKSAINRRVTDDDLTILIRKTFKEWDEDSLLQLIDIANASGRSYGDKDKLTEQYLVLKTRFSDTYGKTDADKWLMMCTKQNLYKGLPEILHLALCSFVKSPLEATVETIGSVINQHGRKGRCSLRADSLSTEVQVAWNGPREFQPQTQIILEEALEDYFSGSSPRFYTAGYKLKIMSSTIASYMKQASRILF